MRRFYIGLLVTTAVLALLTGMVLWRGDQTPVEVMAYSPNEGAEVSSRPMLSLDFSKALSPATFEAGFRVVAPSDKPVAGNFAWRGDHKGVRWTPTAALTPKTVYAVTARGGTSGDGRTLAAVTWRFQTRAERLVYLSTDGSRQAFIANLWAVDTDGRNTRQLTNEPNGVDSFAVSPDGNTIVYATPDSASTGKTTSAMNLWLVDSDGRNKRRLTRENNAVANNPQWSPVGNVISYERSALTSVPGGNAQPVQGTKKLYLLRNDGTQLAPLYFGADKIGFGLSWSPTGTRAAFYDPNKAAIGVYNFTPDIAWFPTSATGAAIGWSPDGSKIVYSNLNPATGANQQIAYVADVDASAPGQPLCLPDPDGESYDEVDLAWAGDGGRVALVRQPEGGAAYHIWTVTPGALATQITRDDAYIDTAPAWSPDSRRLLFIRQPVAAQVGIGQQVWVMNADGSEIRRVAANAMRALWLP